ncbi:MAG: sugar phosphate isomerase/epimerase [Acidobacteriota bacterium]|nr:sugar phosphate isomerase/epimerase [Acidobacteriota bacterium]
MLTLPTVNWTRRNMLALTALAVPASAQVARSAPREWKPKLGVLGNYSEANLAFAKEEGFGSLALAARPKSTLDPTGLSDDQIENIKTSIHQAGIYVSVLGCTQNHIAPDPVVRARDNAYFVKVIETAGKLGVPFVQSASGSIPGRPLEEQVAEIIRVYTEKYFPACEKSRVRILWEPYPLGPNIATSPAGYDALFKAFGNSPFVGLQIDSSHFVWQMMDPIQVTRDYVDRIHDVHLKDTEIRWPILRKGGINPVDGARWWRYRLPGLGSIDWAAFFSVLMDVRFEGAMNIEHEDPLYGSPNRGADFSEDFKTGFRMAHRYLRQYVPVA